MTYLFQLQLSSEPFVLVPLRKVFQQLVFSFAFVVFERKKLSPSILWQFYAIFITMQKRHRHLNYLLLIFNIAAENLEVSFAIVLKTVGVHA